MESFQMRLPGIAKVGNDPHSEQLEASLEEEDNGEDSIEVVKAVHQEGLRLKPDREIKSKQISIFNNEKRSLSASPNVLEGHHKGGEEDKGKHHSLKVLVLYQPATNLFVLLLLLLLSLSLLFLLLLLLFCHKIWRQTFTWISGDGVCTKAAKTATPGRRYSKGRSW